jgi:hypothetical protein
VPYSCSDPQNYVGQIAGSGQCVALIQDACGAPNTGAWMKGEKVRGNNSIPRGTAIATFINGTYPSHPSGNHAAIYLGQDDQGLLVVDQWHGQVTHERRIHFRGGNGSRSNDGDAYSVIR